MHTQTENDCVYAYCDTCRRWVRIEDGFRLASGRWLCNDCMMVTRRKVRRARREARQDERQ